MDHRRLLLCIVSFLVVWTARSQHTITPVLEFPRAGIDDPSRYQGYATRFVRDADGNALQLSLNANTGRVVNVWADAANESISFTARDSAGLPLKFTWGSDSITVETRGAVRSVKFWLASDAEIIHVGHILLGSMRKERDFQYFRKDRRPYGSSAFVEDELIQFFRTLDRLPAEERSQHIALLGATSVAELHARLQQSVRAEQDGFVIRYVSFDGANTLELEIRTDGPSAITVHEDSTIWVTIRKNARQPVWIRLQTDSPSLTPLHREEIFNRAFFDFYDRVNSKRDSVLSVSTTPTDSLGRALIVRYDWLERQVKSLELLSYREKLMAGLPNFATYFGRDVMMSAMMMETIWQPSMQEHVISSVLWKLSPARGVSHEEALGGQAIRENIDEYNTLIDASIRFREHRDPARSDSALARARTVLAQLQSVRENYFMVDDEFQLPVLAGRYFARNDVPPTRKREYLLERSGDQNHLSRLLNGLDYALSLAEPYAQKPDVTRLVRFHRRNDGTWSPGSWRDSNAGYAGGSFAMDVNAIWVPFALHAAWTMLEEFPRIGISITAIDSLVSPRSHIWRYAHDTLRLRRALDRWAKAANNFEVQLPPMTVESRVRSKCEWFATADERAYWHAVLDTSGVERDTLRFLALSLDEHGKPIAVVNTDPATQLFLGDFTEEIIGRRTTPDRVLRLIDAILRPYPVGLFVDGLGPLAANDAYASEQIWERFEHDQYHSPRVVWGREVNLLMLGLAKQILAAYDVHGRLRDSSLTTYVGQLRGALRRLQAAVDASELKHNELWTYRIENGRLIPTRYPTSTDIQLWNLTDLAVQYHLDRLEHLR
jgi:hypothetical protein